MAAQQISKHYKKPWQLLVSVCLTRLNLVSRELTELEERYANLMEQLEFEQSVLNDYETKKMKLKKISEQVVDRKKVSEEEERKIVDVSRDLAAIQDQEDVWTTQRSNIELGKRVTDFDNDQNSATRCIDNVLHMVVEDKSLLNEKSIVYPYSDIRPGESLRQASERILKEHGINEHVLHLSNAPAGLVKIRFDENEPRGATYQGAKVFFMKAQLRSVDKLKTKSSEVEMKKSPKWFLFDEIEKSSHIEYFSRIKKFLN